MKKRITINRHVIRSNKKNNEAVPPISVKTYKSNDYASKVKIIASDGEVVAEVVYSPDKPLKCGATAWVTTDLGVEIE